MEPFILAALTAYSESNGSIDAFEMLLRNSISDIYKSNVTEVVLPDLDIGNISPELVLEMQNLDFDAMTDEQVLTYAKQKGLIKTND